MWRALFPILLLAQPALAWDQHHYITAETLLGFSERDPALWRTLNAPIEVHPIETFMAKAFGNGCGWSGMKDRVFEGVGKDYYLQYTHGAEFRQSLDWARGMSTIRYDFTPAPERSLSPAEILATYSDEPDWQLDDDVPRLKDVGLTKGITGTGTRILRHFWYEGENIFGTDMSEGQELDQRMQLFYNLSLVAFAVDEPYWGYRFLAISLHYLQDLTQPFHIKAEINGGMVYKFDFMHAVLCHAGNSLRSPGSPANPDCKPEDTVENATIKSGWLVGTFHAMYEDWGRGLVVGNEHASRSYVSDLTRYEERYEPVEALNLARDPGGLLTLRPVVQQMQQAVLAHSEAVGEDVYGLFGNQYHYHVEMQQAELLLNGKPDSYGYRMAVASFYDIELTRRQQEYKDALLKETHGLLERAGSWGRQYLKAAFDSRGPGSAAAVEKLRAAFSRRCLAH